LIAQQGGGDPEVRPWSSGPGFHREFLLSERSWLVEKKQREHHRAGVGPGRGGEADFAASRSAIRSKRNAGMKVLQV
jgi:hypothetical protein